MLTKIIYEACIVKVAFHRMLQCPEKQFVSCLSSFVLICNRLVFNRASEYFHSHMHVHTSVYHSAGDVRSFRLNTAPTDREE